MGFDWQKLPVIQETFRLESLPISKNSPDSINIVSDLNNWQGTLEDLKKSGIVILSHISDGVVI